MRTQNINWLAVNDPHPNALTNLRRIASYLGANNIVTPESAIGITTIAKELNIQDSQLRKLILEKQRPGIVQVTGSMLRGTKFYVHPQFVSYPETYRAFVNNTIPAQIFVDSSDSSTGIFVDVVEKPNSSGISSDVAKAYETMAEQKYKDEIARLSDKITHLSKWALPEDFIAKLTPEYIAERVEAISKLDISLNKFMVQSNAGDCRVVIALCLIREQELENR